MVTNLCGYDFAWLRSDQYSIFILLLIVLMVFMVGLFLFQIFLFCCRWLLFSFVSDYNFPFLFIIYNAFFYFSILWFSLQHTVSLSLSVQCTKGLFLSLSQQGFSYSSQSFWWFSFCDLLSHIFRLALEVTFFFCFSTYGDFVFLSSTYYYTQNHYQTRYLTTSWCTCHWVPRCTMHRSKEIRGNSLSLNCLSPVTMLE